MRARMKDCHAKCAVPGKQMTSFVSRASPTYASNLKRLNQIVSSEQRLAPLMENTSAKSTLRTVKKTSETSQAAAAALIRRSNERLLLLQQHLTATATPSESEKLIGDDEDFYAAAKPLRQVAGLIHELERASKYVSAKPSNLYASVNHIDQAGRPQLPNNALVKNSSNLSVNDSTSKPFQLIHVDGCIYDQLIRKISYRF